MSFPNFGYLASPPVHPERPHAGLGEPAAPVVQHPQRARFFTIADFEALCEQEGIVIHEQLALDDGKVILEEPNFMASMAAYWLARLTAEKAYGCRASRPNRGRCGSRAWGRATVFPAMFGTPHRPACDALQRKSTPLIGVVDTAIVGRIPDPVHIGAVASARWCSRSSSGLRLLQCMGTTGLTAQALGAGDGEELVAVGGLADCGGGRWRA